MSNIKVDNDSSEKENSSSIEKDIDIVKKEDDGGAPEVMPVEKMKQQKLKN